MFLIFGTKVGNDIWRKVTEPFFPGKIWIIQKFGSFKKKFFMRIEWFWFQKCKKNFFTFWSKMIWNLTLSRFGQNKSLPFSRCVKMIHILIKFCRQGFDLKWESIPRWNSTTTSTTTTTATTTTTTTGYCILCSNILRVESESLSAPITHVCLIVCTLKWSIS